LLCSHPLSARSFHTHRRTRPRRPLRRSKKAVNRSFTSLLAAHIANIPDGIDHKPESTKDQNIENRGEAGRKEREQKHRRKGKQYDRYVKRGFPDLLQHFDARAEDKEDHAHLDAAECRRDPSYLEEALEEKGYKIDNSKGRDAHSERRDQRTEKARLFIAYIGRAVDSDRPRGRLGDRHQIEKLIGVYPSFFRNELAFKQAYHCIPTTKGERADLHHRQKQLAQGLDLIQESSPLSFPFFLRTGQLVACPEQPRERVAVKRHLIGLGTRKDTKIYRC